MYYNINDNIYKNHMIYEIALSGHQVHVLPEQQKNYHQYVSFGIR